MLGHRRPRLCLRVPLHGVLPEEVAIAHGFFVLQKLARSFAANGGKLFGVLQGKLHKMVLTREDEGNDGAALAHVAAQ